MEMHLVHFNEKYGQTFDEAIRNSNGAWDSLAVVGVMFQLHQQENQNINHLVKGFVQKKIEAFQQILWSFAQSNFAKCKLVSRTSWPNGQVHPIPHNLPPPKVGGGLGGYVGIIGKNWSILVYWTNLIWRTCSWRTYIRRKIIDPFQQTNQTYFFLYCYRTPVCQVFESSQNYRSYHLNEPTTS